MVSVWGQGQVCCNGWSVMPHKRNIPSDACGFSPHTCTVAHQTITLLRHTCACCVRSSGLHIPQPSPCNPHTLYDTFVVSRCDPYSHGLTFSFCTCPAAYAQSHSTTPGRRFTARLVHISIALSIWTNASCPANAKHSICSSQETFLWQCLK